MSREITGLKGLYDYTTTQLLEEIAARSQRKEDAPIEHFCEDCTHFNPTTNNRQNPCSMRHKMQFKVPDYDPHADDWGFYKRICADRVHIPIDAEA